MVQNEVCRYCGKNIVHDALDGYWDSKEESNGKMLYWSCVCDMDNSDSTYHQPLTKEDKFTTLYERLK